MCLRKTESFESGKVTPTVATTEATAERDAPESKNEQQSNFKVANSVIACFLGKTRVWIDDEAISALWQI